MLYFLDLLQKSFLKGPANHMKPTDWLYYEKSFHFWKRSSSIPRNDKSWSQFETLSKTTKLILLDSLLQEVCISSDEDGSLALSS